MDGGPRRTPLGPEGSNGTQTPARPILEQKGLSALQVGLFAFVVYLCVWVAPLGGA